MSEETLLPARSAIEKQLEAVKAYMASPAYGSYLATIREDIATTEASILHAPPANMDDIIRMAGLFGERKILQAQLSIFEEFRTGLEINLAKHDAEVNQPTVR